VSSPTACCCSPPAVHPFFAKRTPDTSAAFRWLDPLGPKRTCLHAVNLDPKPSSKVAMFDLDGTLINSTFNSLDWQWWRTSVPEKLRKLSEEEYVFDPCISSYTTQKSSI
jgi:bifunctional polynucleotide phosphatase/kinase